MTDDLVKRPREAWSAGEVVDRHRLSALADELAWSAAIARAYGGDPSEDATRAAMAPATAKIAALTRQPAAA